jgi:chemotaxis protein CheC
VVVFPEWSDSIQATLTANFSDQYLPDLEIMQEEILLELGNITVGACIGKIAELLNTVLSYSVPQIVLKKASISQLCSRNLETGREEPILIIDNVLSIDDQKFKFYLFIILNSNSLSWLYQVLDKESESLCM